METPASSGVRTSQKDIGLGVILLGMSYAIDIVNPLPYIALLLGLIAVVLLLYRRHDLSIKQGRALYASVIIYILAIIVFVVYFVALVLSLATTLVSQGYTGGNLPSWAFQNILYDAVLAGVILAVIQWFCYFIIPFYLSDSRIRFALVGAALFSIGVKIAEVAMARSLIATLSTVNISQALTIARGSEYGLTSITLSAVSAISFGVVIIYVGNLLRTGRLKTLPGEEEATF